MGRQPMTPERFQSKDVKRRLTKLERKHDYLKADFARLSAQTRVLRDDLLQVLTALKEASE